MTDPRNIAHDKKVQQEKKHHGIDPGAGSHQAVQPGKKPHLDPVAETDAHAEEHVPAENGAGEKTGTGDHA